ncbi:MAG: GC-type dockerin domain-anchored protein [Planctomycetota bacterium]|jgi:hypothetical protein
MDRSAFLPGRELIVGGVAAALAAVAASPSAFGAERVVLGEYFTWVYCGPCEDAEPYYQALVDLYGYDGTDPDLSGTLALMTNNLWDDYEVPWGSWRAETFYAPLFVGTPTCFTDGIADPWPYTIWDSHFRARQAVPTPVTMSISVLETAPNDYTVTVETCLEPDAGTTAVRIYTVMAEDHFPVTDPSPPPTSIDDSRNHFRAAALTDDLRLIPGECQEVVREYTGVVPVTELANMRVIAWAQVPVDIAQPPNYAEVYQAAIVGYPFAPPCPADCESPRDGTVDVGDFLMLLAQWGTAGACDCEDPPDGTVDVGDFLALLAAWGPCPTE